MNIITKEFDLKEVASTGIDIKNFGLSAEDEIEIKSELKKAEKVSKLIKEAEDLLDDSFCESGFSDFKVKVNIELDEESFYSEVKIGYIDNNDDYEELELDELESIYKYIMGKDDWSGSYEEEVNSAKEEAIASYNNLSKDEYISKIGMIFYAEKRLEEIYKELESM